MYISEEGGWVGGGIPDCKGLELLNGRVHYDLELSPPVLEHLLRFRFERGFSLVKYCCGERTGLI